jgi:hypothetical protein
MFGRLPSTGVADALLDERREVTGWLQPRGGSFHNSRCE